MKQFYEPVNFDTYVLTISKLGPTVLRVELTLEQHRLELRGSTYTWIGSRYSTIL